MVIVTDSPKAIWLRSTEATADTSANARVVTRKSPITSQNLIVTNPWLVDPNLSSPSFALRGRNSNSVRFPADHREARPPASCRNSPVDHLFPRVAVPSATAFLVGLVASAAHPSSVALASVVPGLAAVVG